LGRSAERSRIAELLAVGRNGTSAGLVLRGEPGIGKTSMLRWAEVVAHPVRTLSITAVESESKIPHSGLSSVVLPLLDRLDRIPPPQAEALAAALALGPPSSPQPLTVCAGTLNLLAAAAEDAPLLLTIDDAHWLDPASAQALSFAARRIGAEGLVMLFTLRMGELSNFDPSGIETLDLVGLDETDSAALLRVATDGAISDPVISRLHTSTAGNPLALKEIVDQLSEGQLRGSEPIRDPLPAGETVKAAFARRLSVLSTHTSEALVIVAAAGAVSPDVMRRALSSVGHDVAVLEPAEASGIIRVADTGITFSHPLLAATTYQRAPATVRARAHRALAEALDPVKESSRRAWHLAAATEGQCQEVSELLENVARRALASAALGEAALAFEKAAHLSTDRERGVRLLYEAAWIARLVGWTSMAERSALDVLSTTTDPGLHADATVVRANVISSIGAPADAYTILMHEAAVVAEEDPAKAAMLLAQATFPSLQVGMLRATLETARWATSTARIVGGPALLIAKGMLGFALVLRGRSHAGLGYARGVQAQLAEVPQEIRERLAVVLAGAFAFTEIFDEVEGLCRPIVDDARAGGSLGSLPLLLNPLRDISFKLGRWGDAYADASEAIRLARAMEQTAELANSLAWSCSVTGAMGREMECRASAREAHFLAGRQGLGSTELVCRSYIGALELGLGHLVDAIHQLQRAERLVVISGLEEPSVLPWAPDLIEAYARAGRADEARRVLDEYEDRARRTERVSALAIAARCRGMLASDEAEACFEESVGRHEGVPIPFERARTELCYGEWLRRHRSVGKARAHLSVALDGFHDLGAALWEKRARTELRAAGGIPPRSRGPVSHELTPQELEVALLVARGATNREAGIELFLSPKTIESHLSRVYMKLRIRSRTELAARLAFRQDREGVS
jgi:DNA-binding CsgD family transcriptional regulator